jgi:two-component system, cell cycle sensor histidine kinase and response regulator CckA
VETLSYEALRQRAKDLEESRKDLAFRNKQLASLIDNSQLGIVILDKDMRIVGCNKAFERLFLYRLDEMKGEALDDLIVGPDQSEVAVSYTARTLTGRPIQGAGARRRKDKTFMEVKFSGIPVTVDGEVVGAYGVYEDVTPLKKAEEALKETEQAFRALLNAAMDSALLLDDAYRILAVNDIAASRIGYRADELLGRHFPDLFSPEVAEKRRVNLDRVKNTGKPVRFFEKREGMHFDSHFFPIANQDGKVTRIAIFARDITDQQEAEKALKESEEKYRTILESIEEGYYETDLAGNFTFFNESLCRIFGLPENRLQGMNYRKNTGEESARRLYRVFHEVYATGMPHKGAEYEILLDDGTRKHVEVSASLLRDREGRPAGFRGITRDIMERKRAEQERKRLEAQLHQAQRMEAIGTLAGGIAHDFNNLLMAMQGNASLMLLDKGPNHPDYDRLRNIEQYIRNAADLTKQLLGFARGGRYVVEATNLNDLMVKSSKMLGRAKKEISIHTKYQEDLWGVAVDRGQIQQVLMNLFINAWQAMPEGGDLYLETENVALGEDDVRTFDAVPGRYVKITVTDTGVGMDRKTLHRIFEPFFTTKAMGRGTGLGLASAYGIIKNHGGTIKAYSEPGAGSTFIIYLPAGDQERRTSSGEEKDRDEMLRGTETVLLVDDEDTVIEVGGQLLEKLGYTVMLAKGGKEAVAMVSHAHEAKREEEGGRGHHPPGVVSRAPDLVILDMIMPDMGGGATFDRLKEIAPDMKILLSSGYSINGQAHEILKRGCDGFIQKPFNIYELSRKLREIMDRK